MHVPTPHPLGSGVALATIPHTPHVSFERRSRRTFCLRRYRVLFGLINWTSAVWKWVHISTFCHFSLFHRNGNVNCYSWGVLATITSYGFTFLIASLLFLGQTFGFHPNLVGFLGLDHPSIDSTPDHRHASVFIHHVFPTQNDFFRRLERSGLPGGFSMVFS